MNDEHIPGILAQQEHICAECSKPFVATSQWVYKLSVKGKTIWFCRYNCVRAAEKKLKRVETRGGHKKVKNKPTKEALEADLKSGLTGPAIAKKYECSNGAVHKWIKDYGLQELQAVRKPKGEPVIANTPQTEVKVQESPTLNEIEQFHTDKPVLDLPKVEMDGPQRLTQEEWESQYGNELEPGNGPNPEVPRETCEEIWQDVQSDLETLERLYVAEAKKSFRERLRGMLAEVVGEA